MQSVLSMPGWHRGCDGRGLHDRRPIRRVHPRAAVGCLGGVIAVGALGTLAGQFLVTAPVALGAAVQYFAAVDQPPVAPAK